VESVVAWGSLVAAIGFAITIGGVLVRLIDRLNKAETAATAAASKAESAAVSIVANGVRIDRVASDLAEHEKEVAEKYVSHAALASCEARIVDAVKSIGQRVDLAMLEFAKGRG
jgi:hypothetical protein